LSGGHRPPGKETIMRIVLWLLIFVFASPLFADDKKTDAGKAVTKKIGKNSSDNKKTEDNNTFEEKGKFSVGVPEKGFEWKKLQDINFNKTTGAVYICKSKNTTNSVIFTLLEQGPKTDQDKRNYIAGQFDGFKKDFEKTSGGKIIEGEMPKLESNIPKQVSYPLKLQNADKSEFYQYTTIIFGKNTFSVTANSLKKSEAKALNEKVIKSIKELGNDK
jgi:hypothetical protein